MGATVGDTGRGLTKAQIGPIPHVIMAAGLAATLQAQESSLKQLRDIQKEYYEHASAYSKVILGMGYAGAFGIWAGTRQYLSPTQVVVIALALCASLVCYVAFEVYQTIYQVISIGRFNDVINSEPQKIGEALKEFHNRNAKTSKGMMRIWGLTTVLAIAFAVSAVIILFYAFIANLLRIWH